MSQHPAVFAHQEFFQDKIASIPSHKDLIPYLKLLPRNELYLVIEDEGQADDYFCEWFAGTDEISGVSWREGELQGSCILMRHPVTNDLGLKITPIPNELTVGKVYYIIPVDKI